MPLTIAFGFIPPLWIVKIPFLANIVHVDNTFSCVLILHLTVLAGFGFHLASKHLAGPQGRFDVVLGTLLLLGLMFPYLAALHTVPKIPFAYLPWGETFPVSPFVGTSMALLPAAAVGLMLVIRNMLVRRTVTPTTALLTLAFASILLWRHGFHFRAEFPGYLLNPPSRVDFHAKSSGVETVLTDRTDPFRAVGLEYSLFPGWNDVYGLEGINGPEPLINPHYRELVEACGIDRVWGWRLVAHVDTIVALRPVYDFLNIKYYFDYRGDQGRMGALLKPVAMADLDIYRSESPWPRAFFTDSVFRYDDAKQFAELIRANPGRPFAALQNSQKNVPRPPQIDPAARLVVPAHNYLLTTNDTSFDVDAPGPGLVVLQEAWLKKDFRVTINDRPADYFRVNHAFKGIYVSRAGSYRITFAYWPDNLSLALVLSALGAAGVAGSAWFFCRQHPISVPLASDLT